MADLKPCPFCGSAPTVERWHGGGTEKRMIACVADACHVAPGVTGETPREAAERWNERALGPGKTGRAETGEAYCCAHAMQSWREKRRSCRGCDCTEARPCATPSGACYWVEPDLCSVCADAANLDAALEGLAIGPVRRTTSAGGPVPTGSGVPGDG